MNHLYAVLLLVAVTLGADMALYVWRRRTWKPNATNRLAERLSEWRLALAARSPRWLAPVRGTVAWFRAIRVTPAVSTRSAAPPPLLAPVPAAGPAPAAAVLTAAPVVEALASAPAMPEPEVAPAPAPQPAPAAPVADAPRASAPQPASSIVPTTAAPVNAPSVAVTPVQVTQVVTPGTESWARVNISVELPVGATMQVTIATTPNAAPAVTVAPAAPASVAPPPSAPALAAPVAAAAALTPAIKPVKAAPARAASRLPRPALRLPQLPVVRLPALPLAQASAAVGPRLRAWAAAPARPLFVLALFLYLATRLLALDRFPIYFFTDESVHTVLAEDFVQRGLRNSDNELLPTYFSLGPSFNLNGVSVYLQVIPYLLFGKSVEVTRGASALVTLIAAIAVGLILRDIFRARYWWAATLLLSIAPAWFLHSRTAFEYAEVTAYFAGFLYCYLRYRRAAPRFLYGAILFGALAFYTHGLGVVLMAISAVLLLISDYRYHWQQRATVGRGLLLVLVLALPYLRYSLAHPSAFGAQLQQRGSIWTDPTVPVLTKLQTYLGEYLYGLSPAFWFAPNNQRDLERHLMDHYGNLWWFTLPLLIIGLVLTLWRVRDPLYRALLLALLATPVGSALVAIGIPRMLWFIIPAAVLMALGLEWLLNQIETRWFKPRSGYLVLSLAAFVALGGVNVFMFTDALRNGPTWTTDYTLYGYQWGAEQLFGEAIPAVLAADPEVRVLVSPSWANGAEMFASFFLSAAQQARVSFNGLDYYFSERRTFPADYVIVLSADEYHRLIGDEKVGSVTVEQTIAYPNGAPGFYFVQFTYSAVADARFTAAEQAWLTPVTEQIMLDGQNVTVTHPHFGAGLLPDLLDANTFTLINAPRVNPLILDFQFPQPWTLTGADLTTGSLDDIKVKVELFPVGAAEPIVLDNDYPGLPADPTINLSFGAAPVTLDRVRISVYDGLATDPAGVNIHLRELKFIHAP